MQLKTNQKILIVIMGLILAAFAVDRLFFYGNKDKQTGIEQKIKLAERQVQRASTLKKNKELLEQAHASIAPYLSLAGADGKKVNIALLEEFEKIIRVSGGAIVALNSRDEENISNAYKADFRLEMEFNELLVFLYEIQESKLLISLDKMTIVAKGEDAAQMRVDGIARLTIP